MMCPKCRQEREQLCRLWNHSYSVGCEYDAETNPVLRSQQREFMERIRPPRE